jgi:diacylglycerol diphosphate phosphatase / phosphatidate phosphatase
MMTTTDTTNSDTSFQRVGDTDTTDTGDHGMCQSLRWNKTCKEMYDDSIGYVMSSKERIAELLVSVAFFILGRKIPQWLGTAYGWNGSAPYQETSNGDVLVDLGLNFELLPQTVPASMLLLIGVVLPLILLLVLGICSGPSGDAHAGLCVYFLAVGMNSFVTDMMKNYCGKLRPNFYQMCAFDADTKACANDVVNAHLSFPSGHSSLSFCAMTIISLYLLGKVGLHRMHTPGMTINYPSLKTKLLAWLAFALPFGVAVFVAASRVHDYYHHPADIVTGAAIGMVCAHFATSLWYPSIYSNGAGYPLHYIFGKDQLFPTSTESVSV